MICGDALGIVLSYMEDETLVDLYHMNIAELKVHVEREIYTRIQMTNVRKGGYTEWYERNEDGTEESLDWNTCHHLHLPKLYTYEWWVKTPWRIDVHHYLCALCYTKIFDVWHSDGLPPTRYKGHVVSKVLEDWTKPAEFDWFVSPYRLQLTKILPPRYPDPCGEFDYDKLQAAIHEIYACKGSDTSKP